MRILTRKVQESLVIGADCVVTVLRVRGDQVRFRICAPPHVVIERNSESLQATPNAASQDQAQHVLPV